MPLSRSAWLDHTWSPTVALASLLAIIALLVGAREGWVVSGLVLDLALCAAAGLSARFPAAAGSAVLAGFALTVLSPQYPGVGAYATLIPILSAGLARRNLLRALLSAGGYTLLLVVTSLRLSAGESLIDYAVFWLAWVGAAWLTSEVLRRLLDAERLMARGRLAEQRREIARELHDTVAQDLSMIIMRAEQARLHGTTSAADLKFIVTSADGAIRDLRSIMTLLRKDDEPTAGDGVTSRLSLDDTVAEAVAQLRRHGFQPTVSVEGGTDRLSHLAGDTLAKVVREASSNIVQHGQRDSACALMIEVRDSDAEVVVSNLPGRATRVLRRHEPLGLTGLRERVEAVGGEFSAAAGANRWVTRARIPL